METARVSITTAVKGTSGYPSQREHTVVEVVIGSLAHIEGLANMVEFGMTTLGRIYDRYDRHMAALVSEATVRRPPLWSRRVR